MTVQDPLGISIVGKGALVSGRDLLTAIDTIALRAEADATEMTATMDGTETVATESVTGNEEDGEAEDVMRVHHERQSHRHLNPLKMREIDAPFSCSSLRLACAPENSSNSSKRLDLSRRLKL